MSGSSVFFLSDFHLGIPNANESRARERKIVSLLEEIAPRTNTLCLVGDVFDFWFEYRHVVPKYYTRLLGTLAKMTDSGIPIHFFKGNHDLWTFGYLRDEIGLEVHHDAWMPEWAGKKFYIAHGDGKGPGDKGYKRLKKIFHLPLNQRLFSWLHPDLGYSLARNWSYQSRVAAPSDENFHKDKEWLYQYCLRKLEQGHFDYFVFGHRHLPIHTEVGQNSLYVNLGDWLQFHTYAEFDGKNLELLRYPDHNPAGFGRRR
jgi:UDP-2,3-diacylglucosamine hydrolase